MPVCQDARGNAVLLAEDCTDPGGAEPRAVARADRWAGLDEGASGGCEAPTNGGLTSCGELNQGAKRLWKIGGDSAVMAAMTTPVTELPTPLAAVNQAADARIVELTAIVKMLERTLYGTRSERLRSDKPSDEQIAFAFDEIATGVAAIEAELAKAGGKDKEKRAPRPRKEFGAHLERVEIVIEPEVPPGCEGLEKVLIGEDISKRLDVTPAKFRVIVTRRPKYAYRNRDGVVQAPAPAHLIER